MAATYKWDTPTDSEAVTSFELEKSTDDGISWSALATIVADTTNAAVYDFAEDKYYYVDATPVAGEIVRLRAVNATGNGPWSYHHGPPAAPDLCNLYGVLRDGISGDPYENEKIIIETMPPGLSGFQDNANVATTDQDGILSGMRRTSAWTDEQGRWSIDLVTDLPVKVSIPVAGITSYFRIPAGTQVLNFRDSWKHRISDAQFKSGGSGSGVADGPLAVARSTP